MPRKANPKPTMTEEEAELVLLQHFSLPSHDKIEIQVGLTEPLEWSPEEDQVFASIQALSAQLAQEISENENVNEADIARFTRLGRAEFRLKRYRTLRRLYNLMNKALTFMEIKLDQGGVEEVTLNQIRLLTSAVLDQSRDEFGDKSPDTLIDNRQQTIQQIQIIEVVKDHGDNGKVIDGEVVNG